MHNSRISGIHRALGGIPQSGEMTPLSILIGLKFQLKDRKVPVAIPRASIHAKTSLTDSVVGSGMS